MKRDAALRRIARGRGIWPGADDASLRALYPDAIRQLVPDGLDAAEVIRSALALLPSDIRSARAIRNALEGDGESLGDRRIPFMAREGISLRTLVREEETGATMLDNYIFKVALDRQYADTNAMAREVLRENAELEARGYWEASQEIAEMEGVDVMEILSRRITALAQAQGKGDPYLSDYIQRLEQAGDAAL